MNIKHIMPLPEEIKEQVKHLIGKNCLYLLHMINSPTGSIYKFGMTTEIMDRLAVHYNELKFTHIVQIFDCETEQKMKDTTKALKYYSKAMNILTPMFGKVEIITCDDKMIKDVFNFIKSKGVKETINGEKIFVEYDKVENKVEEQVKLQEAPMPEIKNAGFKCNLCDKICEDTYDLRRYKARKKFMY